MVIKVHWVMSNKQRKKKTLSHTTMDTLVMHLAKHLKLICALSKKYVPFMDNYRCM